MVVSAVIILHLLCFSNPSPASPSPSRKEGVQVQQGQELHQTRMAQTFHLQGDICILIRIMKFIISDHLAAAAAAIVSRVEDNNYLFFGGFIHQNTF